MPPCESKLVAIYYFEYKLPQSNKIAFNTEEVKIYARRFYDVDHSGCHKPKDNKPWNFEPEWNGPHLGTFKELPTHAIINDLLQKYVS